MRKSVLDILACPICCCGALRLDIEVESGLEVLEGLLTCLTCGRRFPVIAGIPRFPCDELYDLLQAERARWRPDLAVRQTNSLLRDPSTLYSNTLALHAAVRNANKRFYDETAHLYEAAPEQEAHQNPHNQKRIEANIRRLASMTGAGRMLDLGTGAGNVLKFAEQHFSTAVGIDVSSGMLEQCRVRSSSQVMQADALLLPFRDGLFDTVVAFSVMHHLPLLQLALAEIARVLRPGGVLYTDWDPIQADPHKTSELSEDVYRLAVLFRKFGSLTVGRLYGLLLLMQRRWRDRSSRKVGTVEELPAVYRLAEYHNLERGGFKIVEFVNSLERAGFEIREISYHWHGYSYQELGVLRRLAFEILLRLGVPLSIIAENFQTIALRK